MNQKRVTIYMFILFSILWLIQTGFGLSRIEV